MTFPNTMKLWLINQYIERHNPNQKINQEVKLRFLFLRILFAKASSLYFINLGEWGIYFTLIQKSIT